MIDLAAVRKAGNEPRVHGNGFLQLDVGPDRRLHFWGDPRIPRQVTPTPIHDHSFSFRSSGLIGRLFNIVWAKDTTTGARPTHSVWEVRAESRRAGTEDTKLYPVKRRADGRVALSPVPPPIFDEATAPIWELPMRVARCDVVHAGESYHFSARAFHESTTDRPSATLMVKLDKYPEHKPRVLCPLGREPDNEFDRDQFPVEDLWQIIYDTCRGSSEFGW